MTDTTGTPSPSAAQLLYRAARPARGAHHSSWSPRSAATCSGLNIAYRDLAASQQLVSQLQTESQKLKKQVGDQASQLTTPCSSKLPPCQSAMHAMKPAKDTYEIKPNQSLVIADGHLTLGLIGSPANDSVDLNINGKVHNVAPRRRHQRRPDASTNCHVDVQSFDMFKVTLVPPAARRSPDGPPARAGPAKTRASTRICRRARESGQEIR